MVRNTVRIVAVGRAFAVAELSARTRLLRLASGDACRCAVVAGTAYLVLGVDEDSPDMSPRAVGPASGPSRTFQVVGIPARSQSCASIARLNISFTSSTEVPSSSLYEMAQVEFSGTVYSAGTA